MSRRLERVLRAGETHRLSVRTGALEVSDFTDDTLRLILEAVGQGDVKAACEGAAKWCSLNPRHRAMCREGGDALWTELTRRVFGPNPPVLNTAFDTAQELFYALCRRERARRWLNDNNLWKTGDINSQIDEVDELMTHIDNGGKETPEGRAELANMLLLAVFHMDTYAYGREVRAFARKFADPKWIYTTLLQGTEPEIERGMELLLEYATNQNHEDGMDERMGYYHEYIPTLKSIINSGVEKHQELAVDTLIRLLDPTAERSDADHARVMNARMKSYASALIAQGMNATLLDLINEGFGAHAPVHEREVGHLAAMVLDQMTHALNWSPL